MPSNNSVVKEIMVLSSNDSWGNDVILDTHLGPVYAENLCDLPGRECLDILPSHSKKKNRSKRIQYENMNNPVVERPIPRHKKKKYPTKPKNRSKINKIKESNEKFRF